MSADRDFVDDLLVLARRGALSETEQRRLRDALGASAEARLMHGAGRVFDLEGAVVPGDDTRIELIARRVEKRARARGTRNPLLRRVILPMLAGALITGVAFGALELWRAFASAEHAKPALHSAAAPAVAAAASVEVSDAPVTGTSANANATALPSSAAAANSAAAPSAGLRALAVNAVPAASQSAAASAPATAAPENSATARFADAEPGASSNAAELFARANQARIRGDSAAAVGLYHQLELAFPSSSEARTAHLSLGLLALQQGRASEALNEFRSYRQFAASGPTLAEAFWGEARALRALGRTEEERGALSTLVAEYPNSAYAPAAQQRLMDLR